jgi:hypothetical protein
MWAATQAPIPQATAPAKVRPPSLTERELVAVPKPTIARKVAALYTNTSMLSKDVAASATSNPAVVGRPASPRFAARSAIRIST